jgi:uncharacterized protein
MRTAAHVAILLGTLSGGAVWPLATPAVRAADAVMSLKWDQLVPPAPPKPPKAFFSDRPGDPGAFGAPQHAPSTTTQPLPEGRWMSAPARSSGSPPAVVASLDGKRVQIGGYVVPLDFDATRVKEFLLVPFVGACIHVPPPPPNQIVYVKTDAGIDIKGTFDPVWVTGTLTVTSAFTGLAEAGYSLEAEKVEPRPLKD